MSGPRHQRLSEAVSSLSPKPSNGSESAHPTDARCGRRSVLMLCYHYPPRRNGGVERSAQFARYLPDFGWRPTVLTPSRPGEPTQCEESDVVRAPLLFARRSVGPRDGSASVEEGWCEADFRESLGKRWLEAIARRATVPDPAIRWIPTALGPALRILRRRRIDVIYSSSPPESVHILALLLKRISRRPWVLDLRDPWTVEPLRASVRRPGLRRGLETILERACVGAADAVIFNTPEAEEAYRERHPGVASRMLCIPNGYDDHDLREARSTASRLRSSLGLAPEEFVLTHAGSLCRHLDTNAVPRDLLDALGSLRRERRLPQSGFRLVLAGHLSGDTRRAIRERNLDDLVTAPGRLPHRDALRLLCGSDALLLYDPLARGDHYVHGKLYEYLAAGRPILGILPPGASRRLLERAGRHEIVGSGDPREIQRAIRSLLEGGREVETPGWFLQRYERRRLTEQLAHRLGEILAVRRDPTSAH